MSLTITLRSLFETHAEGFPAVRVLRPVFRHQEGRVDRIHAKRPGDVDHPLRLAFELVDAEMAGGHPQPIGIEIGPERLDGIRVHRAVDAAETFDFLVAERAEQRQRVAERREITGAVELERDVCHRSVPSDAGWESPDCNLLAFAACVCPSSACLLPACGEKADGAPSAPQVSFSPF